MTLRTFKEETHNAPNVAQYTAQPQPVSNIVHRDSVQRASVLQHVSQNVRRLRHAAEMSQTALAEKSGVSRRMLVAIEAGEKNVSLTTLDRVAEALEVAFSDLIQAPDNRDPGRINELAWAGSIPGSKAVLLSKANATARWNSGNGACNRARSILRNRTLTAGANRSLCSKAA